MHVKIKAHQLSLLLLVKFLDQIANTHLAKNATPLTGHQYITDFGDTVKVHMSTQYHDFTACHNTIVTLSMETEISGAHKMNLVMKTLLLIVLMKEMSHLLK